MCTSKQIIKYTHIFVLIIREYGFNKVNKVKVKIQLKISREIVLSYVKVLGFKNSVFTTNSHFFITMKRERD